MFDKKKSFLKQKMLRIFCQVSIFCFKKVRFFCKAFFEGYSWYPFPTGQTTGLRFSKGKLTCPLKSTDRKGLWDRLENLPVLSVRRDRKDRKGLWDRLGYQVSFPSENLVALPLNRSNKKYKQENTNNSNHYFLKGNNYLF